MAAQEEQPQGSRRNIILGYEKIEEMVVAIARVEEHVKDIPPMVIQLERQGDRIRDLEVRLAVLEQTTATRKDQTALLWGYFNAAATLVLTVMATFFLKH